MKLRKLCGAVAAALLLSTSGAHAALFYMDGGEGTTRNFSSFALGQWSAVSTYTDANTNGVVDEDELVVDTVSKDFIDLETVSNYWGEMGVNPAGPLSSLAGYGTTWGLYFDYTLYGQVKQATGSSILAYYYGGVIDIYYDDLDGTETLTDAKRDIATDNKVMSIDVTGSGGGIANFLLYGRIAEVDPGFFFFASGADFNDLIDSNVQIDLRIDTNLDTDQVPSLIDGKLVRTSTLDGSARFDIPEPGVLALLGLGLAGLGFARRNKKQA